MAYHLLTSALRGTFPSAAPRLFRISRLFPRQVAHVAMKGLTPSTTAINHNGVCTTSFAIRRLSDIAAPVKRNIRLQLEGHIGELFKDDQISPAFLSPALPPTPAKDLSEASEFMQQLTQNNAAIIRQLPVQHPLISVTHEELIQPILDSAETDPDLRKPVAFVTRGTGTGKTRALVESQLALMQHKDKNVLPIAITFNNHTAINERLEGLNLHADADMAYAIMVCSRILAAFHAKEGLQVARTRLLEAVGRVGSIGDYEVAAKRIFQATLAHTVRRMRQARPEQPIDTVVLMVDETYMAHEAVGGAATTIDFSSNLRQALLDEKLLPDEEHVDVALCVSSLVPLDVKTESNRQVLSLPVASRVSTRDVVEKWWLPALMGKQGDVVKAWVARPENALHLKRLELLAATMAPIPRHLEFALRSLRKLYQQNGGKFDTEVDSFRQVMRDVIDQVKDKYMNTKLPLHVLRAALERETLGSSPEAKYQLPQVTLAKCIRKSMIVNTEALLSNKPFVPDASLFVAAYCMREGRLEDTAASADESFARLGEDFLNIRFKKSGDSLENSTAWMLHLRLLLLLSDGGGSRRTTLRELFGQKKSSPALPDVKLAVNTVTSKDMLPHSEHERDTFLDHLERCVPASGEVVFWPELNKTEHFDHLLAVPMVEDGAAGQEQRSLNTKPFLVFIECKARHPSNTDSKQQPEWKQAKDVLENLPKAANIKRKTVQHPCSSADSADEAEQLNRDSLLDALADNRCCFVYLQTAEILPRQQRLPVYHLDKKASENFLGPMAPIYTAMRAADKVAEEQMEADSDGKKRKRRNKTKRRSQLRQIE